MQYIGFGHNLRYKRADGSILSMPGGEKIQEFVKEQLETRSPDVSRTVVLSHGPGLVAKFVKEHGLTRGLVGSLHQVQRHRGSKGELLPEKLWVGGRTSWPWRGRRKGGRRHLTVDKYPQGYSIHVVEEDRIDSFYRPLFTAGEHVIMVYQPDPRRAHRMRSRLPQEVEVRGQVLDLKGNSGTVMVQLGDEEVEAETVRRRLWVDFSGTMTLKEANDVDDTLKVTVEFPDGRYAVSPGPERDWTVKKVESAE